MVQGFDVQHFSVRRSRPVLLRARLIFAVFIAGREGSYARTAEEKGKIPAVFLGCQCGHGTGGQRHCKGKQGGNDACR